jgi:hypothetical protein
MNKKLIILLVVAFLLFFLITQPVQSAGVVGNCGRSRNCSGPRSSSPTSSLATPITERRELACELWCRPTPLICAFQPPARRTRDANDERIRSRFLGT